MLGLPYRNQAIAKGYGKKLVDLGDIGVFTIKKVSHTRQAITHAATFLVQFKVKAYIDTGVRCEARATKKRPS
jgi:hypothetical protein